MTGTIELFTAPDTTFKGPKGKLFAVFAIPLMKRGAIFYFATWMPAYNIAYWTGFTKGRDLF